MKFRPEIGKYTDSRVNGVEIEKIRLEDGATEVAPPPGFPSFVGGDPSAGSPTDTLLRLNPPCRRQARIPHLEREAASPTHN